MVNGAKTLTGFATAIYVSKVKNQAHQ